MKKYIIPSIKVVTINACNILTPASAENEYSSKTQLSRRARFSAFDEDFDEE